MALVIETSLWIDFTRARSPLPLKQFLAPFFLRPDAHLVEPVMFEVFRHATKEETGGLRQHFQTFPMLESPSSLWRDAAALGQACRQAGYTAGSLDLLVAAVAAHHKAEVVTLDEDFERIATITGLRVKLLKRP